MAACIAVVSDTNQPLYLRTADCPDPLFYHFKVHASLDVIADKLAKRATYSSNTHEQTEQYLGLLFPMEDHKMYGYVTNTQIKFIIVMESNPTGNPTPQSPTNPQPPQPSREADVRSMFQRLHSAYVDLVCSPFYTRGSPIDPSVLPAARRFDEKVAELLAPHASIHLCPILSVPFWDKFIEANQPTEIPSQ